jgi:hypothetical protein
MSNTNMTLKTRIPSADPAISLPDERKALLFGYLVVAFMRNSC